MPSVELIDPVASAIPSLDIFGQNQRFKVEAALRSREISNQEKQAKEAIRLREKEIDVQENIAAQSEATDIRLQKLKDESFNRKNESDRQLQEASQKFQEEQNELDRDIEQKAIEREQTLRKARLELAHGLAVGRVNALKENQVKAKVLEKEMAIAQRDIAAAQLLRVRLIGDENTEGEISISYSELRRQITDLNVGHVNLSNSAAIVTLDSIRSVMRIDPTKAPGFLQRIVSDFFEVGSLGGFALAPGVEGSDTPGLVVPALKSIRGALFGASPDLAREGVLTSGGEKLAMTILSEITPALNQISGLSPEQSVGLGQRLQTLISGYASVRRLHAEGETTAARTKSKELEEIVAALPTETKHALYGVAIALDESGKDLADIFEAAVVEGKNADGSKFIAEALSGLNKSNRLAMAESFRGNSEIMSLFASTVREVLNINGVLAGGPEDVDPYDTTIVLSEAVELEILGIESKSDVLAWLAREGYNTPDAIKEATALHKMRKDRDKANQTIIDRQLDFNRLTLERDRVLSSPGNILEDAEEQFSGVFDAIGGR